MPRLVDGKRVRTRRRPKEESPKKSPSRQDSTLKDAQGLLSKLRAAPETNESQYEQDLSQLTRKVEAEPIDVTAKRPTSSLFDSMNFEKEEEKEPEQPQRSSLLDYLAVGATPVLAGFLSGNMEGGFGAASKGIAGYEARQREDEQAALDRTAALQKERLEQMGKGPDRMKRSETALVKDPETGKTIRVPISQAVGKEAAPSPGTETFSQKKEMEAFKHQLDLRAKKLQKQLEESGPDFDKERKLRKDLESLAPVEEAHKIQGFVSNIKQIEENPIPEESEKSRGGQDLNLLFSYMKILDPGSVVREGEQMLARRSGKIPDVAYTMLERLQKGKILPDQVRESFIEEAKNAYEARVENTVKPAVERYQNIAERYGIDKKAITPRFMSWDEAGATSGAKVPTEIEQMSDEELEEEIQRLRGE